MKPSLSERSRKAYGSNKNRRQRRAEVKRDELRVWGFDERKWRKTFDDDDILVVRTKPTRPNPFQVRRKRRIANRVARRARKVNHGIRR